MMIRAHDTHGFTVGELLIAVGIVSVLVAIALPLFTSSLADAKDSVDAANCRSARAAATSVCIIDHSGDFSKKSIEEWVQVALDDGIPKRSQVDPSQTLNCRIESSNTRITFFYGEGSSSGGGTTPGGGGGSNVYPGTDIPLEPSNDAWPPQEYWKPNDPWELVTLQPGGIFQYEDGNYYVITKSSQVNKGQAASGPSGVITWDVTQKITGRVIDDWVTNEQKSDLKRGDLCKIGDDYYVYIDNGPWAFNPVFSPSFWYKLP